MGPVAQPVFKTGAAWQPHARSVRLRRRSAPANRGNLSFAASELHPLAVVEKGLRLPHNAPINEFVDQLRQEGRGWVPYVAPINGGTDAEMLSVLTLACTRGRQIGGQSRDRLLDGTNDTGGSGAHP